MSFKELDVKQRAEAVCLIKSIIADLPERGFVCPAIRHVQTAFDPFIVYTLKDVIRERMDKSETYLIHLVRCGVITDEELFNMPRHRRIGLRIDWMNGMIKEIEEIQ